MTKFIEEQKDKNYTLTVSLQMPEENFNTINELMQGLGFKDYGQLIAEALNFYLSLVKLSREAELEAGVVKRYEIGADGEGRVAIVEKEN